MSAGVVGFFVFIAVLALFYGATAPANETVRDLPNPDVLDSTGRDPATGGLFDRLVRPALRNFVPQSPFIAQMQASKRDAIRELLVQSGNPWNLQPEEYQGLRFLAAIGGAFLGILVYYTGAFPINNLLAAVGLFAALGFYYPKVKHDGARGKRRKAARMGLPEGVDLLRITMNSGMTFQPALGVVAHRLPPGLIREEFSRVSDELKAGSTLEHALRNLARRVPGPEVESFCNAVMLGERLGSDINETLASQSAAARAAYEAMLDEKIGKLPTTLFFPILGLMLPALFAVILAPAMSNISAAFG